MTEKELGQLFFINKEIIKINEEIEMMESKFLTASFLDGTPKGNKMLSKTEKVAVEIVYLKEKLEIKLKELFIERGKIERFLDEIEDGETRLIFRLRYVNGMDWRSIGYEVGYDHSAVFRKHKKYLQQKQQGKVL